MLSEALAGALTTLVRALGSEPGLEAGLVSRWLARSAARRSTPDLGTGLDEAATRVASELPAVTQTDAGVTALSALFADERAVPLLAWCAASTARRDVRLAPLLPAALRHAELAERAVAVARDRVVAGPLLDSLAWPALLGPRAG